MPQATSPCDNDKVPLIPFQQPMQHPHTLYTTLQAQIMRLPPEIMSAVFLELAPTCEDLLLLTKICQGWRTLALSDPLLWTYVDMTRHHLAKLWIQRSQEAPLHIRLLQPTDAEMVRLAVPLTSRIASLELSLNSHADPLVAALLEMLAQPAPLLRSLDVRCMEHNGMPCVQCSLPTAFLGSGDTRMPVLSHLKLRLPLVSVSWTLSLRFTLSTVLYLDIESCQRDDTRIPPIEDFLEALNSAPLLKVLHLGSCLRRNDQSNSRRIFLLASLIELSVAGTTTTSCSNFLEHVSTPQLISIALSCDQMGLDWVDDADVNIKDFDALLCSIPPQIMSHQLSRLKIETLSGQRFSRLSLTGWFHHVMPFTGPVLAVQNTFRNRALNPMDLTPLLYMAISQLNCSQLRWVCIETTATCSLDTTLLLAALQTSSSESRIEELQIVGGCANQIVGALADPDEHGGVIFRHLKYLHIRDVDIHSTGCYSLLLLALDRRSSCGLPVEKLILGPGCHVDEECRRKLQKYTAVTTYQVDDLLSC
ncbi:hypothetical protein VNI00_018534 [Paramarasmius palmivorus]|uniref:F-box domain-containing protein n=1 Tax=Paramarasmius palmivorus TaxID=297713 RepID=A0AAW0AWJ0_9AGAR